MLGKTVYRSGGRVLKSILKKGSAAVHQGTSDVVDLKSQVKPRPGVFATAVDDELVLFDPEKGAYYGAGLVGERIWSLISDGKTVDAVCKHLVDQFDVDRATCETDVVAFLSELEKQGLISVG